MRMIVMLTVALGLGCEAPHLIQSDEVAMSTPALAEATELVGHWTVDEAPGCRLRLMPDAHRLAVGPAAEFRRARFEGACPAELQAAGWFPAPLGFVLTDDEGRALLTFQRTGPDTYAAHGGTAPTLRRAR